MHTVAVLKTRKKIVTTDLSQSKTTTESGVLTQEETVATTLKIYHDNFNNESTQGQLSECGKTS